MASYSLPSHLSPEAKDLINSLLQKNPKDRIGLEQILEHPFIKRNIVVLGTNLTQDSGIHTMSSRRDSAFSDGALPSSCSSNVLHFRKASSDCFPCEPNILPSRQTHSMEYAHFSRDVPATLSNHCYHPNDPGGGSQILSGIPTKTTPLLSQCSNSLGNLCLSQETSLALPRYHSGSKPMGGVEKSQTLIQLCSHRLLPTHHQTKNAILSIQDDGEVTVEFIKKKGSLKREVVCEIMRISPDGLRIVMYEPEGGRGATPSSEPAPLPEQGADRIYSIENLPEKHWKKYMYAFKFVELVRAKTPKVTFYSDKAKCLLMENLVDFEVCFYEGE